MPGYLDAIVPRDAVICVGGELLVVERARLGLHLRLSRISDDAFDALKHGDSVAVAAHVKAYLALVIGDEIETATASEQLHAFMALDKLNAALFILPFMRQVLERARPPAYDYEGRGFALWIHKLATRYGWTRHYILDELYPEEVACYLQEILVAEYDEEDRERVLSEMAYNYDKSSKRLTFRPLPRPAWMIGVDDRATRRIHVAFLPMGEVINLSNLTPEEATSVFAS